MYYFFFGFIRLLLEIYLFVALKNKRTLMI